MVDLIQKWKGHLDSYVKIFGLEKKGIRHNVLYLKYFFFLINSVLNIDSFMGVCIHFKIDICVFVNNASQLFGKNKITATLKTGRDCLLRLKLFSLFPDSLL